MGTSRLDPNPTFLPPHNAFPHNQHLYFLFTKQILSTTLLDHPRSPQMLFFHFRVKTNTEGKKNMMPRLGQVLAVLGGRGGVSLSGLRTPCLRSSAPSPWSLAWGPGPRQREAGNPRLPGGPGRELQLKARGALMGLRPGLGVGQP